MKIRSKMLLFCIGIVAVPLAIIGFFAYQKAYSNLLSLAVENTRNSALQIATIMYNKMENEINLIREVSVGNTSLLFADSMKSDNENIPEELVLSMNGKLKSFRLEMGEKYETAFIANKKGVVISDALDGKYKGINVSDRDYFKNALSGKIDAGQVVVSKGSGEQVVLAAMPFKTKHSEIVGVIAIVVKLKVWTDYIKDIKIGKTGYVYIVSNDTMIIAHPDKELVMKTRLSDLEGMETITKRIMNRESGVEKYTYKGLYKIAGFSHDKLSGWTIVSTQNESDFMAVVYEIRNTVLLVGGAFLVISVILVIVFTKSITSPLNLAVDMANAVSEGDFTKRLNLKRADEFGTFSNALDHMAKNLEEKALLARNISSGDLTQEVVMASDKDVLGESLKQMVDNLNNIISRIKTSSDQVMNGSELVSDSSQSLSQGATEQAASMEEISSSMTQIASQINKNAENANECEKLAVDAKNNADVGNKEMQNMITAMSQISDSSKEIEKIIKAIDEIAFQTNLLALNAAVEAARAGRHGKGFAVVAEEVRNLAARSAKAAKETAELIEGSVHKVDTGMEIAEKTADSLSRIVEGGSKVASLVAEIATACNDQAQGVSQINQGLSQMDQVTQKNTANAEETASASEELSGQAIELQRLISNFRLRNQSEAELAYKPGPKSQKMAPVLPDHRKQKVLSMPKKNLLPDNRFKNNQQSKAAPKKGGWGNPS